MKKQVYGTIAGSIAVGAVATALALSGSPIAAVFVVLFGLGCVFG